jgi:hypothetical protein
VHAQIQENDPRGYLVSLLSRLLALFFPRHRLPRGQIRFANRDGFKVKGGLGERERAASSDPSDPFCAPVREGACERHGPVLSLSAGGVGGGCQGATVGQGARERKRMVCQPASLSLSKFRRIVIFPAWLRFSVDAPRARGSAQTEFVGI